MSGEDLDDDVGQAQWLAKQLRKFIVLGWLALAANVGLAVQRAYEAEWIGLVAALVTCAVVCLSLWMLYKLRGRELARPRDYRKYPVPPPPSPPPVTR